MDNVLFLLCIPDEDEGADSEKSNKQYETKSSDKFASKEPGTKAASRQVDSVFDPAFQAETKKTGGDQPVQPSRRGSEGKTKGAIEANGTGSKLLRDEKQKNSCPESTAPNGLPTKTIAIPASAETQEKPPDASDLSAMAATENSISTSGMDREPSTAGQVKRDGDDPSDMRSFLAALSPAKERSQSSDGEEDSFQDSSLITMEMIGKGLADDFWDFDEPHGAEAGVSVDGVTVHVSQNGEEEAAVQSEPRDNTEVGDQSTKKEDASQEETAAAEEFSTCPNTPLFPLKQEKEDIPSKAVAQNLAGKFDISPVHEKQLGDTEIQVAESDNENFAADQPGNESATTDVKGQRISGKFTMTRVIENGSSEPSKADTDGKMPVSSSVLVQDAKPENPIFKSASIGGMLMGGNKVDQLPDSEKGEVQRRSSLPAFQQSSEDRNKVTPGTDVDGVTFGVDENDLEDFMPKLSLRTMVKDILKELGVKNIAWQKCTGDRVWQVTFVEDSGVRCEDIMLKLAAIGVGRAQRSSISILPVTIHAEKKGASEEITAQEAEENEENEQKVQQLEEKATEFQKSIKSRLVVRQVVKSVESNAEFTFDYVMLIILASGIAAIGLVENSSVVLVASMLISPLMGPILAGTFGFVIKNYALRNLGICSELFGLGICLVCGFVFGLLPAVLEVGGLNWRNSEEWPTLEMSSRGAGRGLAVGALIALPSGAGVALSVLGGNIGSLVGVAISASLLPPAVNAGMLWSSALVMIFFPPSLVMQQQMQNISEVINGTTVTRQEAKMMPVLRYTDRSLSCPHIQNNEYVHIYSCNTAADFAVQGTISLLLTILNIICIVCMGCLVLKIKEVAPRTSTQLDQNFFKKDVKIARESYTTTKGPQSAMMGKKWLDEYKALKKQMELGDIEEEEENDTIEFQQILHNVENSPEVNEVLGRIPNIRVRPMSVELAPEFHSAALKHVEKHGEMDPVYLAHTHAALHGAHSPLPIHSVYSTVRSIYHTVRSPYVYPSNPQIPHFLFPTTSSLLPELPTPKLHSPSQLAPISEAIDLGDKTSEDGKHPRRRTPRLKIPPPSFPVTQLAERPKRGRRSTETPSEPENGAQNTENPEEKLKGKKGVKSIISRRNPRKKSQKSTTSLLEVTAEVPLLEFVNEDAKESGKAARV